MERPRLNHGYSTGSCAAGAAKAAALLLEGISMSESIEIPLPNGSRFELPLLYAHIIAGGAEAAIRKDGGDDPDITTGLIIKVKLESTAAGSIAFAGGDGVGRVTLPGLSVAVGEPAINPGPRGMITAALREVSDKGYRVTVSIPGGAEIAQKTFNPKLGIVGGLSILGTTGIVRPYSLEAMRASLLCGLDVTLAAGIANPIFVPGNLGAKAAQQHFAVADLQIVEVGNDWGLLLDKALERGTRNFLLLGHPGKLAKLWLGEWDTHSSRSAMAVGDVLALARKFIGRDLPDLPTVEGVFGALEINERRQFGDHLAELILRATASRLGKENQIAVVLTNMKSELIGQAGRMDAWQKS